MLAGEEGAGAQGFGAFGPVEQTEAARADGIDQSLGDLLRVGGFVAPAREDDRAEPFLAPRLDRAGRGIEAGGALRLDPVGEEALDLARVDRGGGEDARTGGRPLRLRDREPFGAGERRCRIEPETAPAAADPVLARGRTALRNAIGEGEGDAGCQIAFVRVDRRFDERLPAARELAGAFSPFAALAPPAAQA